jgi:hypothetical protein
LGIAISLLFNKVVRSPQLRICMIFRQQNFRK